MAFLSFVLYFACTLVAASAADATDVAQKVSLRFLSKPLMKPASAVLNSIKLASRPFSESDQKALIPKVETIEMCKTYGYSKCKNEDYHMPNGDILRVVVVSKTAEEEAIDVIIEIVACVLIGSVCAYLYKDRKQWPVKEKGDANSLKEWSSGICDCGQDLKGFFCACCCMPIRWADTISMLGISSFWMAFFALLMLQCVELIPYCTLAWCGTVVFLLYYRTQIKLAFGMPSNLPLDCLIMCCCTPCAIAQEGRHVDRAAALRHEAVLAQMPLKDGAKPKGAGKATEKSAAAEEPEAVEAEEPEAEVTAEAEAEP